MNDKIQTIVVGMLCTPPYDRMFDQSRRVYSPKGIAATINTFGGGQSGSENIDRV